VTGGAVVPATDIFSVGAVMYELFTGKKPFDGESLQSVFYKIVSTAPPDMTLVDPGLPPVLNTIVQTALAKEPGSRYASALDMANALTAARADLDRAARSSKSVSLRSAIETGLSTRTVPTPTRTARRRPMLIGGAAAVVIIAAGGVALARSRNTSNTATATPPVSPAPPTSGAVTAAPPSTSTPSAPTAVEPAGSTRAAAPVVPPQAAAKPATVKPTESRSSNAKAGDSKVGDSKVADAKPTSQELELFRTLQAPALDARRRAAEAGATNDQLQAGDDHNKAAMTLVQQGKVADAVSQLTAATNAWASAEHDARAAAAVAAAAATKPRVQAEAAKPDPVSVQAPTSPAAPPVTRAPAPNPNVEIGAVITNYAHAIESRDVNEVKRAYPGATSEQLKGFDQFFGTIRSLRATFTVASLDVSGSSAEAHLTGAYDYVTSSGETKRQPLNFQATFRRDAGTWKLMSVR
jgi:serine/threonine-protein kinase